MKIAIVSRIIYPFVIGGSARFTTFLANSMVKQGIDVEVICAKLPDKKIDFPFFFKVKEIDWRNYKPFFIAYYMFIKKAASFITTQNYDIIYWTGWAVKAVNADCRIPTIANPFGLEPFKDNTLRGKLENFLPNALMKKGYKCVDKVVSEGGKITEEITRFLKVERQRIVEIPDGVDIDYINKMKKERHFSEQEIELSYENTFLFVGRLEKNKGVEYLLKAFDAISDKFKVELLIVGDGTQRKMLESSSANRKVKFLGFVPDEDLFNLYKRADLFVMPTLYEGLPIVILEAMACGLPVISTDTGGVPTAVSEENGFLIPPKDVDALKSGMINFLRLTGQKRKEMGRCSYELVQSKFLWKTIAKETIEVCKELLRNG